MGIPFFSSLLSLDRGREDARLVRWAISQLTSIHSPNADAELDRFSNEIGRLPDGSLWEQRLVGFKQEIRDIRRAGAK
jgi:hypothetical protein